MKIRGGPAITTGSAKSPLSAGTTSSRSLPWMLPVDAARAPAATAAAWKAGGRRGRRAQKPFTMTARPFWSAGQRPA